MTFSKVEVDRLQFAKSILEQASTLLEAVKENQEGSDQSADEDTAEGAVYEAQERLEHALAAVGGAFDVLSESLQANELAEQRFEERAKAQQAGENAEEQT